MKKLLVAAVAAVVSFGAFGAETISATVTSFDGWAFLRKKGATVKVTTPASGATVLWSTTGAEGPWSTERPTFDEVGTYPVWVKVSAEGYDDFITETSVNIKATGNRYVTTNETFTLPDGTTAPANLTYATIEAANSASRGGDIIWIDRGRHMVSKQVYNNHGVFYKGVYGPEETIVDRGITEYSATAPTDNTGAAFYPNHANNCFEGLTIVNAYAHGANGSSFSAIGGTFDCVADCHFTSNRCDNGVSTGEIGYGTCVRFESAVNATVVDCVFSNHWSKSGSGDGRGVFVVKGKGGVVRRCTVVDCHVSASSRIGEDGTVEDCVFKDVMNISGLGGSQYDSGAGLYSGHANVKLLNCVFTNCIAGQQAAVSFEKGGHLVSNCVFVDNHALLQARAGFRSELDATVVDCVFRGNTATNNAYAAIAVGANSRIVNTLVADSEAKNEPAAVGVGANTVLENVTFANNVKTTKSGISALKGTYPVTAVNCAFYHNYSMDGTKASETPFYAGGTCVFTNCAFTGTRPNNVSTDSPNCLYSADFNLVDPDCGDYRPAKFRSPLVDAGTNLTWMVGAKDLGKKNARILGKRVDIGCYEFRPLGLMLLLR